MNFVRVFSCHARWVFMHLRIQDKNVGNYCIQLVIGYSRSLIECMLLIPTFLYNNHLIGELLDIWDFFRSNLSKYGITFIYFKSSGAMVAIFLKNLILPILLSFFGNCGLM